MQAPLFSRNRALTVALLWAALVVAGVVALMGAASPNLAMAFPPFSNAAANGSLWTVARGESTAWKILPDRLEWASREDFRDQRRCPLRVRNPRNTTVRTRVQLQLALLSVHWAGRYQNR